MVLDNFYFCPYCFNPSFSSHLPYRDDEFGLSPGDPCGSSVLQLNIRQLVSCLLCHHGQRALGSSDAIQGSHNTKREEWTIVFR